MSSPRRRAPRAAAPPERTMGALELNQWLGERQDRGPLARNISMLDGVIAAVVAGPISMDPRAWICPLLAIEPEAFNTGGTPQFAAIKAVIDRHNAISAELQSPSGLAPIYGKTLNGELDATDWCEGFLAAVDLNRALWKDVLDPGGAQKALMMPILMHAKHGLHRLRPRGQSRLKQAHTAIPFVVEAMREHFQLQRYGRPHPNTLSRS